MTTRTVTATTNPSCHTGAAPARCDDAGSPGIADQSTTDVARITVSQFSQEKFPDKISQSWVAMMKPAAALAYGWGANSPNGATSWARWLAATSTRCRGLGSR